MNNKIHELDDVDDDVFISKKPQNYIFAEKEESTSKSLANTLNLVRESEMIGHSTLEDLSSQRETLQRVENDLDTINTTTRSTQKHLNNMRSIFGGIKSLFSNTSTQPAVSPSTGPPKIVKSATLSHVPSAGSIPSASSSGFKGQLINNTHGPINQKVDIKDEFEANLSEIGFGLGRLKEMASKLGDEIGDQNDMLDRITDKSERAGDSIKHQNRQMQRLLKKG